MLEHIQLRRRASTLRWLESYYSFFIFLFVLAAITNLTPLQVRTTDAASLAVEGDAVRQIGYTLLFISSALPLLLFAPGRILKAVPVPLIAFFLWCLLSVIWSDTPSIALRRLVLTVMLALTCFLATFQIASNRGLRIIFIALLVLMIGSLAAGLAFPTLSIHQSGDRESGIVADWRGLFYHKNLLGSVAAISLLYAVSLLLRRRLLKWSAVSLFLSLLALLLSGSKTSMALGFLCTLFLVAFHYAQQSSARKVWAKLSLVALPFALLGVAFWLAGPGGQLLSDPDALTGRVEIWQYVGRMIATNPIQGLGFQSVFETGDGGAMATSTSNEFYRTLSHAHNGYLEILASVGIIGLILFLWAVPGYAVYEMRKAFKSSREIIPLVASVLLFSLLQGVTESGFADRDRPVWLLTLLTLGVLRASRRALS